MKPILVYGWYGHGNIGDELFKLAFQTLFPNQHFIFTDSFTPSLLEQTSTVIIGGGSFLDSPIETTGLENKKILYLGVGMETNIHSSHQMLLDRAKLIATRTPDTKHLYIPDLVFALPKPSPVKRIRKSILYIPNVSVVPTWKDFYWKHSAWNYFKMEVAQTFDELIKLGYQISFLPMCQSPMNSDIAVSMEIISSMEYRDNCLILDSSYDSLTKIIASHEMVLSQRYHGCILSEICDTPYISAYHHDKLKFNYYGRGLFIPYYGIFKADLINKLCHPQTMTEIEIHSFDELKDRFNTVIGG